MEVFELKIVGLATFEKFWSLLKNGPAGMTVEEQAALAKRLVADADKMDEVGKQLTDLGKQ